MILYLVRTIAGMTAKHLQGGHIHVFFGQHVLLDFSLSGISHV